VSTRWVNIGAGGTPGPPTSDTIYDIIFSLYGLPQANIVMPWLTFVRQVDFDANFLDSKGTVGVNPTAQKTFTLTKNGSPAGTIVVATNGVVTFTTTGGIAIQFLAGDRLEITTPTTQDSTLRDVAFTLKGLWS